MRNVYAMKMVIWDAIWDFGDTQSLCAIKDLYGLLVYQYFVYIYMLAPF